MAVKRTQCGATFLGMLTIVSIVGLALYAGIRLFPAYQEYWSVSQILKQTSQKLGSSATPGEIKTYLQARWTTDYVESVGPEDIEINKLGAVTTIHVKYEVERPFIGNISLLVNFDTSVKMEGSGSAVP